MARSNSRGDTAQPQTPEHKIVSRTRMGAAGIGSPSPFSREPRRSSPATVISSLSIPVQGAVPVKRPIFTDKDPVIQPGTDRPGRAPRKSKSNAMNALRVHSSSSSDPDDLGISGKNASGSSPQLAPELDMSTVTLPENAKSDPVHLPSPATADSEEVKSCPVFRPTEQEFKDPTAYIQSIAKVGHEFGICKIIPPESWEMPFVTDTRTFRFKTRVQRLNQIEAAARAKLNFLEQLYRFHKQQSNTRMAIPTINNKPLDLWLLRREVQKLGGYEQVNIKRWWMLVGQRLGYTGTPGLSAQLKSSYTRVILPFEHFSDHVRNSPTLSPSTSRTVKPDLQTHQNIQTTPSRIVDLTKDIPTSPASSPLSASSDDEDRKVESKKENLFNTVERPSRTALNGGGNNGSTFADSANRTGEACEVCHKANRGEEMLLCDGCDCGFHIFCLDPPLSSIPKGQWFCHVCLFGGGEEFGFDEGEEHSLSSFQARDAGFRSMWFKKHPPDTEVREDEDYILVDDIKITESHMEQQFWELVQSPNETVEVEYGADIHSTTHGSAMPTLETHPLDPYSKDPWNLTNLPVAADSLLRYIKSDISGMTVPWTYVGMTFSTFCWHNEDHYTYSINYMHWGATKTWYGIPGSKAGLFEAAMKQEAPDLFDAQPDLLFQLVTLMNPSRLAKSHVPVYSCYQRPGEFVVTFPKAYHAGFNHGLNLNEAVNFALPDWLPFDRECVQLYRDHRKHPVFSHDELLVTIAQYSPSIKTAIWLSPCLQEMKQRETSRRARIRAEYPNLIEVVDPHNQDEDQAQCTVCNAYCYLSQVTCQCGPKTLCLEHALDHRTCGVASLKLRLRLSDVALNDLVSKVEDRAMLPVNWRNKLHSTLEAAALPSLRSLRALLAEGERISYTLPELENLRVSVTKANEWVDVANSLVARKQHRKRNRKFKPARSDVKAEILEEVMDRPDRTIPDVYSLLEDVTSLGFDSPEIASLRVVVQQAETLKLKAADAYGRFRSNLDRNDYLADCDSVLTEGSSLNIYVPELFELERVVLQHRLLQEMAQLDDSAMTLDEVRQLLARASACGIESDNSQLDKLQKRRDAGDEWEQRAAHVLEQERNTIEELAEFENPEATTPVDPTVLDKLRLAHSKAVEYERQALAWLHPEDAAEPPKLQDVLRLAVKAEREFSIPAVRELRRTANFASDLEARCESVLKYEYRPFDGDSTIFDTIKEWTRYSRDHLSERFQLPNFHNLTAQLAAHEKWLERLPWFCKQHKGLHGQEVLTDVLASTDPEDDMPPNDEYFTCICPEPVRPPSLGSNSDAVQCDHCFARFHGVCARRGGSCPFCDIHHWNGTLRKERSYHYCFLPSLLNGAPEVTKNYSEDWARLETIVARVDRLMQLVGAFLNYACQPQHQKAELLPQVRHYMRKLFRIGFAVAASPDISYGLDLAGLHCILAIQTPAIKPRKRRRPKFTFGQDIDVDWADGTRCVCRGRTHYLLNLPTVECESCNRLYHCICVFFSVSHRSQAKRIFQCPLCLIRKNRPYPTAEVRVKFIEDVDPVYVDLRACLESFSKDLIKITLPPPSVNTVFLDLIRFFPGCPERSSTFGGSGPRMLPSNGDHGSRAPEDPSTSLARALVGPHLSNEANFRPVISPRGEKRKLSVGEEDRPQHPSHRPRTDGDARPNGSPSQKVKSGKPRENGTGDDAKPLKLGEEFPSPNTHASSSNQSQSAVRKIRLVVKPANRDRMASTS